MKHLCFKNSHNYIKLIKSLAGDLLVDTGEKRDSLKFKNESELKTYIKSRNLSSSDEKYLLNNTFLVD